MMFGVRQNLSSSQTKNEMIVELILIFDSLIVTNENKQNTKVERSAAIGEERNERSAQFARSRKSE